MWESYRDDGYVTDVEGWKLSITPVEAQKGGDRYKLEICYEGLPQTACALELEFTEDNLLDTKPSHNGATKQIQEFEYAITDTPGLPDDLSEFLGNALSEAES